MRDKNYIELLAYVKIMSRLRVLFLAIVVIFGAPNLATAVPMVATITGTSTLSGFDHYGLFGLEAWTDLDGAQATVTIHYDPALGIRDKTAGHDTVFGGGILGLPPMLSMVFEVGGLSFSLLGTDAGMASALDEALEWGGSRTYIEFGGDRSYVRHDGLQVVDTFTAVFYISGPGMPVDLETPYDADLRIGDSGFGLRSNAYFPYVPGDLRNDPYEAAFEMAASHLSIRVAPVPLPVSGLLLLGALPLLRRRR